MDYDSFEKRLIQKQNLYIKQLEEQLDVYREKDKAQELLIENLNQALDLFTEELTKIKAEKEEERQKEK